MAVRGWAHGPVPPHRCQQDDHRARRVCRWRPDADAAQRHAGLGRRRAGGCGGASGAGVWAIRAANKTLLALLPRLVVLLVLRATQRLAKTASLIFVSRSK